MTDGKNNLVTSQVCQRCTTRTQGRFYFVIIEKKTKKPAITQFMRQSCRQPPSINELYSLCLTSSYLLCYHRKYTLQSSIQVLWETLDVSHVLTATLCSTTLPLVSIIIHLQVSLLLLVITVTFSMIVSLHQTTSGDQQPTSQIVKSGKMTKCLSPLFVSLLSEH